MGPRSAQAAHDTVSWPRVHIVGSTDTKDVTEDIIDGLAGLGVDATAPPPSGSGEVRSVVVLLTEAAANDPEWAEQVSRYRMERLVPVKAGPIADEDVPDFLRTLNWVFYRRNDPQFLAKLFIGINTDSARFRDTRDTRALAERWEGADHNPDFLLEDLKEVHRRAEIVAAEPDAPVEYLDASLRHAKSLRRGRNWRRTFRTAIAIAAVTVMAFTAANFQQAMKRSNNAVAFSIGNTSSSDRPDLAAFKAGASIYEAEDNAGVRGQLSIAVDSLSQRWPDGYVSTDDWGVATAALLSDGAIAAISQDGTSWRWGTDLDKLSRTSPLAGPTAGGDVSSDGSVAVTTDGSTLVITSNGDLTGKITDVTGIQRLRLAPANDRAMIQIGNELRVIDTLAPRDSTTSSLGTWDAVYDIVQTSDGDAAALAARDGALHLVLDDGTIDIVANDPGGISSGSLSPDGRSFALAIDNAIWTWSGDQLISSGIVIPKTGTSIQMTGGGLVLVSDRTRGNWVADPHLGINIGQVCNGFVGITDFVVDAASDRVLCIQSSMIAVDSLDRLAPRAGQEPAPSARTAATSTGRVGSLSIVGGLIRLERPDTPVLTLDPAGLSLSPGFARPAEVSDADSLTTGAHIGATGIPTSVAAAPGGNTFAIGFTDGRLIEVDIDEYGNLAQVGEWQLPDHSPVIAISWSEDSTSIFADTDAGALWERPSSAGCWSSGLLYERISERAWRCYPADDINQIGEVAKNLFSLRSCEDYWGEQS